MARAGLYIQRVIQYVPNSVHTRIEVPFSPLRRHASRPSAGSDTGLTLERRPLPHMVSFTRFFPTLDIPFSAPPALGETVFRPHACQSAHTLSQLPSSKAASFVPRYSVHLCLLSFSFLLAAAPVHRSTTSPGPRSRRPKNQKPSAASSVSPSKRSDAHLSRANCSLHATGRKPMALCCIRPP